MLEETLEILQRELGKSLYETLIMMGISLAVSLIFGLTLGFLLYLTADRNFFKTRVLHKLVAFVINFIRSVPFIILVVFSLPLTFYLVGTKIGPIAAAVPMSISATVFLSRLIEMSLKEVDKGVIEAAFSTGASSFLIIKNVLMVEAAPSIARGVTVTFISLIGFSAMAGMVGGGGIGNLAIQYGYYRYSTGVMIFTIVFLVVIVQFAQYVGDLVARKLSH